MNKNLTFEEVVSGERSRVSYNVHAANFVEELARRAAKVKREIDAITRPVESLPQGATYSTDTEVRDEFFGFGFSIMKKGGLINDFVKHEYIVTPDGKLHESIYHGLWSADGESPHKTDQISNKKFLKEFDYFLRWGSGVEELEARGSIEGLHGIKKRKGERA